MAHILTDSMPMVSVRILTYNSSRYIIETLDSVYDQTYKNIELVISDDCSQDSTVDLCQGWIDSHRSRFVNVVFLTSPVNTGVCANSKRSLEAATGDWIKGLGGDDLLVPTAIEQFISFVQDARCDICASKMGYIDDEGHDINISHGVVHSKYMDYLQLSYTEQLKLVKQRIIVPGPVLFYSRKILQQTGGPDPRFGSADEWSFLYKVLKGGFRIYGVDALLVKYRVRKGSLSHIGGKLNSRYYRQCNRRFLKEVIIPDLRKNREWMLLWHDYIYYLVMGDERWKVLNLLDPFWYVHDGWSSVKARLGIRHKSN